MKRALITLALIASAFSLAPAGQQRFSVVEATIPAMQAAMAKGQLTSRQLVEAYLIHLGLYEDRLNAALAVNRPAPFGVGFVGAQCSEPKLIELAFAFEQATKKRVPPAPAP